MTPQEIAEAIITPRMPEGDVIITTGPLLGLGDHAVYSTLAKRFKAMGKTVLLDGDSAASNAQIYDLFWRENPHLDGLTDRKPNSGYVRQGAFYEWANRLPGHRSIEAMERAHGLPPPYSIAPSFNYTPKGHPLDLTEIVLVDFSAVSSRLGRLRIAETMKMMAGRFRNPRFLQILHPPWVVLAQERLLESAYAVTSIYEYIDMLAACRAWVGSEAGGQSLASAVRGECDVYDMIARPEIVVLSTRQTFNSRGYTYRNVDYRVTANDGAADFHSPIEVEVMKYEHMCAVRRIGMEQRRVTAGG